jgi:hypothetical protein
MQRQRSRIVDVFYVIGAALLLCVFGVGTFVLADIYHVSPLWIFFGLLSVGFVAFAREEYRTEFRSPRFVAFVIGWLVVNVIVVLFVVGAFGWLWLIPALLLEQFLFYMTVYWLFDVPPPSTRRWPFQRTEPPDRRGRDLP